MKKAKVAVLFVLIFSLLTACHNATTEQYQQKDYSKYTSYSPEAVINFNPTNLEELEQETVYIVKGKFLDDAQADLQYGSLGQVLYGCTISTFEVTTSYKGSLSVGDQIKVTEEYYIDEEEKAIYHIRNYYPSDIGREYILFLGKYPPDYPRFAGLYCPRSVEYGRYPVINNRTRSVDIDSFKNAQLNLGEGDSELYRTFYEDVIAEYMR